MEGQMKMTVSDIKMIMAMLVLIRDNAKERNEDKTAKEIDSVLDVLKDQALKSSK